MQKSKIGQEYDYESLFSSAEQSCIDLSLGLSGYRTKTIRSGNIVECEIYPMWRRGYARAARKRASRAAQRRLNDSNSTKHLIRLINTNFGEGDIMLTVTYSDDKLPPDDEHAYRDTVNYIRRLKRVAAKSGYPPLKYIIVTETHDADGLPVRVHHHIIINFPDRDAAERMWKGGNRTQSRRLQPDENGLTGLAVYIAKAKPPPKVPKNGDDKKRIRRKWRASKNLKKPIVSVSDKKVSRRAARKITKYTEDEKRQYFEKLYPGCTYIECTVTYSSVVSGAYIRVRMRR